MCLSAFAALKTLLIDWINTRTNFTPDYKKQESQPLSQISLLSASTKIILHFYIFVLI